MMTDSREKAEKNLFKFKQFNIKQDACAMKVGTDGILLGAWADTKDTRKILDIGTGTGLIALMLAQRSAAKIDAVEVEEKAWQQAKDNFEQSPWKDYLRAYHTSIQDFAKTNRDTYDLIVSNPPFFSGGVFSANQARASVRHTVKLPNGDLLSAARNLLTKEGRFCVVLPVIEGLRFKEMAINYGLYCSHLLEVFPKADKKANRLLMRFEKQKVDLKEDRLLVYETDDSYSEQMITLTKDFYLNL